MIKYCQIINEETGLVSIGNGSNSDYYKSIGMVKHDVEQSDVDNCWYLKEKCPHKSEEEKLREAKAAKYNEALQGAKDYIENEAAYQYDENNSIEATDGNIGKMTANAFGLAQGAIESVTWTSKEDNVLILNAEDVARILLGLGAVQAEIWNIKFVTYKNEIEQASTIEEVEAIEINYYSEEPVGE